MLIVEDDFLLLMELESILSEAGADVVGACRSVEEALPLAANDGIAAAILDVQLGRTTVAPVARQLAEHGTPFMFYTGQRERDPMLAEWPDVKVLSKPARPGVIVTAVADLINERPVGT